MSLKLDNIVAAVDVADELAEGVLKAATSLATNFGSKIHALSVFTEEILEGPLLAGGAELAIAPNAYFTESISLSMEEREKHFTEMVAALVPADMLRSSVQIVGRPVHEILEHAEKSHADLIVLGSHHRGFWGRLFEGSVSQEVARRSHCGLFIVTPEFLDRNIA